VRLKAKGDVEERALVEAAIRASVLEAGLLAPSSQRAQLEAAKVAEVGGADKDEGNGHVQPRGDPAHKGEEDEEAHKDDGSAGVHSFGGLASLPVKSDSERPPRAQLSEQALLEAAILASQPDEVAASMVPGFEFDSDDEMGFRPLPLKKETHLQGEIEGESGNFIAAQTHDDSACGLHACWGDELPNGEGQARLECPHARQELERRLSKAALEGFNKVAAAGFHAIIRNTCVELSLLARRNYCDEKFELDCEIDIVWRFLPEHAIRELKTFAVSRAHEDVHRHVLEQEVLDTAVVRNYPATIAEADVWC